MAANCAAQRAAEARPIWFRTFVQFCRVRAAASGPGIEDAPPQARRLCEPQKLSQQLGPARRENRLRFSRLKNRHSPKHSPVLCPVSASLRLRFRSAAFPSPAGISSRFCSPQNERNPSLGGRATVFRIVLYSARLRDSSIFGYRRNSRIASLGGARFSLRVLRSGRAGPTSRGREMLTHFNYQPQPKSQAPSTPTTKTPLPKLRVEVSGEEPNLKNTYYKILNATVKPAITIATILISLIRIFSDGPEVSLNGSPTVSPTTVAL